MKRIGLALLCIVVVIASIWAITFTVSDIETQCNQTDKTFIWSYGNPYPCL